jgi:preprotein translocase subunit YajC
MQPLVLLALLGLMYVLLVRPQQQRVKAQRALVTSLEVGDEVVTVGGLMGRIVHLDDEVAEVETIPGTVLRFRRVAISGRIPAPADGGDDDDHEHDHESSDNNGEVK